MNEVALKNPTSGLDGKRHQLAYFFTCQFLLLLIALGYLVSSFFRSISTLSNSASYVSDTILQKSATSYELEINMLESVIRVLKYVQQPQAEFREKFELNRYEFESLLRLYADQDQTQEEHALHQFLQSSYEYFANQGQFMMANKDKLEENRSQLRGRTGRIYSIVDHQLNSQDFQDNQLSIFKGIAERIDHELDEMVIEGLLGNLAPEVRIANLNDLLTDVESLIQTLQDSKIRQSNAALIEDIRVSADQMKALVETIILITNEMTETMNRMVTSRQRMGDLLKNGIQKIATEQLADSLTETQLAIGKTTEGFVLSTAFIVMITVILSLIFIRRVLRPIKALTYNVAAFGRGELTVYPSVNQNDEIGYLTEQFNTMAKSLSQSQTSLNEANANLESKISVRTAEVSEANCNLIVELERRTQIEQRLMQATEMAVRASQAKSTFLASMSHELRTPMNAILGFSDVMVNEVFGPLGNQRYKGYVQDIQNSGNYLLQLINDLLMLGAIDEGRLEMVESEFDPREVTQEVMSLVAVQATAAQIELRCRIAGSVGLLYADRRHVKQILINLVVNAVKFTEPGGKILIRWRMRDGETEMSVIDTGVGIPSENVESLFNRYQRGDHTIAADKQGVGLGLSLVKGMVEVHHAQISVRSYVGRGTEMTVHFPPSRARQSHQAAKQINVA